VKNEKRKNTRGVDVRIKEERKEGQMERWYKDKRWRRWNLRRG